MKPLIRFQPLRYNCSKSLYRHPHKCALGHLGSLSLVKFTVEVNHPKEQSTPVLLCFAAAVKETAWPKAKWREKGSLHLALFLSLREIGTGPQGRNESRDHRGMLFTSLPPLVCSVCFLIQPRTTWPGVASPTMNSPFPHQLLITKIDLKLAYKPFRQRQFFN
jgi:hypothetical protein